MSEVNVANHVLESILKDLSFLKENNFLPHQTYRDVVAMLPNRISSPSNTADTSKPPLPTRKSTSSTTNSITPPVAQPREMPSFPKLPVRRTPDWQSTPSQQHQAPQQLVGMVMPSVTKNILHSEPEKSTPPPPAYTQKPTTEPPSLATAEALYDYKGEDPSTDLSFRQGDIIEVTEYVNDDWWKGSVNGKSGIFPQNHVKKIPPPIKAKRPWVPPTAAKPSFSTSSNTSNTPPQQQSTMNNTTMPYSYPPPPTAMYTPPPAQPPIQAYGQPAAVPVVVNSNEHNGESGSESKVKTMGSKFGKQVGTAAMWGFGATIGSQAANAIF
ncbi:hypothetical protein HMPREF1544_10183 [Mucor circinelloides 1006PhL]|uniref:SH3 domain-containing protein n=1 Tax=Mucor circinelloides f. circinelloides (strain 1006PhL) TaxID=1220926 RepID=S2J0I0_MUCC1|nr:hypothetical protein HMPREF1544_10183 [Mucor circinelloides 1006PhL]